MSGRKPPPLPPHLSSNYQSLLAGASAKTTVVYSSPSKVYVNENEKHFKRRNEGLYKKSFDLVTPSHFSVFSERKILNQYSKETYLF